MGALENIRAAGNSGVVRITPHGSINESSAGRNVALKGEVGCGIQINILVPVDPACDGHVRARFNFQVHIVEHGELKGRDGGELHILLDPRRDIEKCLAFAGVGFDLIGVVETHESGILGIQHGKVGPAAGDRADVGLAGVALPITENIGTPIAVFAGRGDQAMVAGNPSINRASTIDALKVPGEAGKNFFSRCLSRGRGPPILVVAANRAGAGCAPGEHAGKPQERGPNQDHHQHQGRAFVGLAAAGQGWVHDDY